MTSPNLSGSFITTFNGRRCTAVPRSVSEPASSEATPTPSSSSAPSSTPTPEETTPEPSPSTELSSSTQEALATTPTPTPEATPEVITPTTSSESIPPSIVPTTSSSSSEPSSSLDDILVVAPTLTTTTQSEPTSSQVSDPTTPALSTPTKTDSSLDASASTTTEKYDPISSTPAEQVTTLDFADSITSATSVPSSSNSIDDNSDDNDTPIGAIVGSVLGGLFFVILIALLLWWWRKRQIKKRRSTLLTPLTLDPSEGPENDAAANPTRDKEYIIETGSVGPTPRSARFKAAVNYNVSKLRSQLRSTDVGIDRTSRMSRAKPPMSRHQAMLAGAAATKDKTKGWVLGMLGRLPSTSTKTEANNVSARSISPNADSQTGSKPDFMKYLGMTSGDVQRHNQNRQANHSASNSACSTDLLLANNRHSDPFSDYRALDSNVLPDMRKVASRTGSDNGVNPFSDNHEVPKRVESGYIAALRQTRMKSTARSSKASKSSLAQKGDSIYWLAYDNQEVSDSRLRFRSDQFDLDQNLSRDLAGVPPPMPQFAAMRPESGISVNSNSTTMSVRPPKRPLVARIRGDSLSSKWSSGGSLGDWSDPGPDIGPGGLALTNQLPSPLSKGAPA
ncbi:hypothetical protein Cpir12675_006059 [Ceratocystis pirilliformis]|uniref:Uncharacterized protein n=1 Tax=Ceratocystis pirilliformis TaxID=259994 RepID=A0ABR3YKH7_9PEZI